MHTKSKRLRGQAESIVRSWTLILSSELFHCFPVYFLFSVTPANAVSRLPPCGFRMAILSHLLAFLIVKNLCKLCLGFLFCYCFTYWCCSFKSYPMNCSFYNYFAYLSSIGKHLARDLYRLCTLLLEIMNLTSICAHTHAHTHAHVHP